MYQINCGIQTEAVSTVNRSNCGTLPDFGNWCIMRKDGAIWDEREEVCSDKYESIKMMLAAAKGESAKPYNFDIEGNDITLDYSGIIQLVKASGYIGFIGVDYRGERLGENEGIHASKSLFLKSAQLVHYDQLLTN